MRSCQADKHRTEATDLMRKIKNWLPLQTRHFVQHETIEGSCRS